MIYFSHFIVYEMKRHNIIYIVLLLFIVLFGMLFSHKSVEGMTPKRYVMYGPWIGEKEYPAELKELEGGKKIYVIDDGTYTKMVSEDGKEEKYYVGRINELNLNKWNQSTSTGGGKYLIRVEEDHVEIARLKKAEEDERDRLAKIAAEEKTERDRLAKIAAEEKTERDRLAKIAADEKTERDRLAKIAADENTERDRLAKIAADEKTERDRLAKIAADEKTERDRLAKIAAEKDERIRLAKIAADENTEKESKILKQSIPVVMSTIVKRYQY